MRLRPKTSKIVLVLVFLMAILVLFNDFLVLKAYAFWDVIIEGPVATAILVTLMCLIALTVGIIIYLKYFRKKGKKK